MKNSPGPSRLGGEKLYYEKYTASAVVGAEDLNLLKTVLNNLG